MPSVIELVCPGCSKAYNKLISEYNKNKKYGFNNFCSRACSSANLKKTLKSNCTNCGKSFERPLGHTTKSLNLFCSRSCAATYNNRIYKRNKVNPQGACSVCNIAISTKLKYCKNCKPVTLNWSTITIKEAIANRRSTFDKYLQIRTQARKAFTKSNVCAKCTYSLHTEICHIKQISVYDLDTKVSEVNSKENLVELCPNCHWEFDNGLFTMDDLESH